MSRPSSFSSNSSQQQGPSPPRQPSFQNQPSHGPRASQGPHQAIQPPQVAIQRQDSLPLHTLSHQQAPNNAHAVNRMMRDHCDGSSAMEVDHQVKFADNVVSSQEISSSQMFGGQSSPEDQDQAGLGQATQGVGTSQMQPLHKSIESWLANLGCQEYIDIFTKKGVQTVDQLDEINLEDFAGISMPQHQREKLWKAILRLRNRPTFTSTPSSMLRTSSNASTVSFGGLSSILASQPQTIQATRFTLKQTMSFQVKEEVDDDS